MQRCAICTRSAEPRLAIELDGNQHLDSREAYRRERRKDMLLQQHGYLVLRFLAEDVGRQLDTALDAILRGLSHRLRGACGRSRIVGQRPSRIIDPPQTNRAADQDRLGGEDAHRVGTVEDHTGKVTAAKLATEFEHLRHAATKEIASNQLKNQRSEVCLSNTIFEQ